MKQIKVVGLVKSEEENRKARSADESTVNNNHGECVFVY